MIQEYHRPDNLEAALVLLNRKAPKTIPLGGGNAVSKTHFAEPVAVVDLQNLNLNNMEKKGTRVVLGATAKLQSVVDWDGTPEFLREAILKDANANLRNTATIGGSLIRSTGKSRMATVLLAVDCQMQWEPGGAVISFGEWLAIGRKSNAQKLMTAIYFDEPQKVVLESVAQTPAGFPLLAVCVSMWTSGRTRLVVAEASGMPECLCDGKGFEKIEEVINARSHIPSKYTSSLYQDEILKVLTKRIINQELSHEN